MPDRYEGSFAARCRARHKDGNIPSSGGGRTKFASFQSTFLLPTIVARTKDIADENQLASDHFNKAGPAESGVIAIVPKRTSTSAAVDVYQIPAGTTRPDQITASYCLSVEKNGKNVAKLSRPTTSIPPPAPQGIPWLLSPRPCARRYL